MVSVSAIVVIVLVLSTVVRSDETKALLQLGVDHIVSPTVKTNDYINYTIVVEQTKSSRLEAVDIVVEVLLPESVQFATTRGNESAYRSNYYSKNRADFMFSSLPLNSQVQFNFFAVITDESLTSGLHYASTPIKLSYKSKLSNNAITTAPFVLSTVAQVPYFVAGCLQPLGISSGAIKFYQFSGSTTQVDLKPDKARYNGKDDAWCADVRDNKPYIQVFMSRLSRITGVSTWGRKEKAFWVKKYSLEFSLDGVHWNAYGETGFPKQFDGNYDRFTKVQHWLLEPIVANYIRLYPTQWSVGVCMRLELYGCEISTKDNCIQPLGMENGKIPEASLSSLQPPEDGYAVTVNFSRLNKVAEEFPNGWMADYGKEDWLEIDLGSSFQVTAIAVQGGWKNQKFVTQFQFRYSNGSGNWHKMSDTKGKEKKFPGSAGGLLADMVFFSPTIKARYVRIIPLVAVQLKVMRLELYGCLVEEHIDAKHAALPLFRRSVLIDEQDNTIFVCLYTDDETKAICKRSTDGEVWQSLSPNIMGIIYQARASRRLLAVDRQFHKAFSDDGGNTWYSISDIEWNRQIKGGDMITSTNIEDILPSKEPAGKLTWTVSNGNKWGVSGNGIHIMNSNAQEWKLSAGWKCCGL